MAKIPKNRPDTEMLGGWQEQASFEHASDGEPSPPAPKPATTEPAYAAFLTPELQAELGKALLTLKLNLYKEGIIDYKIKVSCQAGQVVLTAAPVNNQAKNR